MKGNIFTSSILMLALGLGCSACSENDLENSIPEMQPQAHVVTLHADVNQALTRCAIESDGSDDTFHITGWNHGDKVYAIYANGSSWATVEFSYDSSIGDFTAITDVDITQFQYVFCGGTLSSYDFSCRPPYLIEILSDFDLGVDFNNNSINNLLLTGVASVENGKLAASLSPKTAIACVHNNTDTPISVTGYKIQEGWEIVYTSKIDYNYNGNPNALRLEYIYLSSAYQLENATVITIPANSKRYFSLPAGETEAYGFVKIDGSSYTIIATAKTNFEVGKIYKVNFD